MFKHKVYQLKVHFRKPISEEGTCEIINDLIKNSNVAGILLRKMKPAIIDTKQNFL